MRLYLARGQAILHTRASRSQEMNAAFMTALELADVVPDTRYRLHAIFGLCALSEFRVDGTRFLSGWCGHCLVCENDVWLIRVRQVNLIDCDRNLRNPSIVL